MSEHTYAPVRFKTPVDQVVFKVTFEVITPVFGGGVHIDPNKTHVKDIDPITPVRGNGVRGQLRFWWRATHGCLAESIDAMRKAEDVLWGNASTPGRVHFRLTQGNQKPTKLLHTDYKCLYASFPLRRDRKTQEGPTDADLWEVKGTFELILTAPRGNDNESGHGPSLREQLQRTLQAWLLFGGVGGRTRRGFGALKCTEFTVDSADEQVPSPSDFMAAYAAPQQSLSGVPSLHGAQCEFSSQAVGKAESAHQNGIAKLRDFRQGPNLGRNPGKGNFPGRSRWPEPDQIRRLEKTHARKHPPEHSVQKFPRAHFGMPIIFHFKDKGERGNRDPNDTTLKPRRFERLASPLILRPFADGTNGYRCLALVLRNSYPQGLQVELNNHPVEIDLSPQEADSISPIREKMPPTACLPAPLAAFLNYFKS